MNFAGWTEVATFTKTRNQKLRDTFRIFTNELAWVKSHQDKTGKDVVYASLSQLEQKIEALKAIRFVHATGEVPKRVVSQYAAFTEEI